MDLHFTAQWHEILNEIVPVVSRRSRARQASAPPENEGVKSTPSIQNPNNQTQHYPSNHHWHYRLPTHTFMSNITLSIDCKLIDKSKLKPFTRKDGTEALFLSLTLVETPNSQYGQWMVKQDSTKAERDAKVKSTILGNAKTIGWKAGE